MSASAKVRRWHHSARFVLSAAGQGSRSIRLRPAVLLPRLLPDAGRGLSARRSSQRSQLAGQGMERAFRPVGLSLDLLPVRPRGPCAPAVGALLGSQAGGGAHHALDAPFEGQCGGSVDPGAVEARLLQAIAGYGRSVRPARTGTIARCPARWSRYTFPMIVLRLSCPTFWVDVRLREIRGRWIASADTPDGPSLGLGHMPVEAIESALEPFDGIAAQLLASLGDSPLTWPSVPPEPGT